MMDLITRIGLMNDGSINVDYQVHARRNTRHGSVGRGTRSSQFGTSGKGIFMAMKLKSYLSHL